MCHWCLDNLTSTWARCLSLCRKVNWCDKISVIVRDVHLRNMHIESNLTFFFFQLCCGRLQSKPFVPNTIFYCEFRDYILFLNFFYLCCLTLHVSFACYVCFINLLNNEMCHLIVMQSWLILLYIFVKNIYVLWRILKIFLCLFNSV